MSDKLTELVEGLGDKVSEATGSDSAFVLIVIDPATDEVRSLSNCKKEIAALAVRSLSKKMMADIMSV